MGPLCVPEGVGVLGPCLLKAARPPLVLVLGTETAGLSLSFVPPQASFVFSGMSCKWTSQHLPSEAGLFSGVIPLDHPSRRDPCASLSVAERCPAGWVCPGGFRIHLLGAIGFSHFGQLCAGFEWT